MGDTVAFVYTMIQGTVGFVYVMIRATVESESAMMPGTDKCARDRSRLILGVGHGGDTQP